MQQRSFSFSGDCVYGALQAGSEQIAHIEDYVRARDIPVYYGFYNPATIPFSGRVPTLNGDADEADVLLGCRVLPRSEVHSALAALPVGTTPSFDALVGPRRGREGDGFAEHGWRLEDFVADEVLRCREGRVFVDSSDEVLSGLLYRRSAPIAAAVVTTIDVLDGVGG